MTIPGGNFVEVGSRPSGPLNGGPVAYLTASQVGELLQVSPRTVERWAKENATMPRLKVGRTLRFPLVDLQRWLERRTQGSRKSRSTMGQVAAVEGERA